MHTEKEIQQMREELDNCQNPLFLFHDDQDGLCSFLQLCRRKREGRGIVVSSMSRMIDFILRKVEEYDADKVFILDIPVVDEEFFEKVKVPIVWIDHHDPVSVEGIKYFNVRIKDKKEYLPVSYTCYQISEGKDMWISMVGCIGDAYMPPFYEEFSKKYPELLAEGVTEIPEITTNTKLGMLSKVFAFVLKGNTSDIQKCIKILTRIKTPDEILKRESSQGKFIYNHFYKVYVKFQSLLEDALNKETDGKLLVYTYRNDKMALSATLANELSYILNERFIILARLKEGYYMMSIRYNKKIPQILKKALIGIDGTGGGHPYACGARVKEEDFERFVQNIKKQL